MGGFMVTSLLERHNGVESEDTHSELIGFD